MGSLAVLSCEQVQAALSARLDGEDPGIDDDVLDAHVASCPDCQAFLERAAQLNRTLSLNGIGSDMPGIPDLSEAILAGVEPEFRKQAANRALSASFARVLLAVLGVAWVVGAVATLGDAQSTGAVDIDPASQSLAVEAAAARCAMGFALFVAAWMPRLSAGTLPVFGAMWMFSFGFSVRDLFLASLSTPEVAHLVLLLASVLALAWTWVSTQGWAVLRNAWSSIKAEPIS
ncbi:zf-HC2 domain-containing protein [Corynebacterium vitaeruminis]|nr:zf-HC2 domain-containing protein [Corynebacterium vitaeruminis]